MRCDAMERPPYVLVRARTHGTPHDASGYPGLIKTRRYRVELSTCMFYDMISDAHSGDGWGLALDWSHSAGFQNTADDALGFFKHLNISE